MNKFCIALFLALCLLVFSCEDDIYIAARWGDVESLQKFINEGVDVDGDDNEKRGYTPLMMAASSGHKDAAKILIDNGANIHAEFLGKSILDGRYLIVQIKM